MFRNTFLKVELSTVFPYLPDTKFTHKYGQISRYSAFFFLLLESGISNISCVPSNQYNIPCFVSTHSQFQFKHAYPISSSFSTVLVVSPIPSTSSTILFLFTIHSQSLYIIFLLLLLSILVSSVISSVFYLPCKISDLSLSTKFLQYSAMFKLQYLFHLNCKPC